jgi:hypothetical protein
LCVIVKDLAYSVLDIVSKRKTLVGRLIMKKENLKAILIAMLMLLAMPLAANATTKSWTTTALASMAHGTDYTWKVDTGSWGVPTGEYIVGAYLDIKGLNNWQEPEADYMNIYLLNNLNNSYTNWPYKTPLTTYKDETLPVTETYQNWEKVGQTCTGTGRRRHCTDNYGWVTRTRVLVQNPAEDFHYGLTGDQIDTLTGYLSDSKFGLGFDPNCHYSDNLVTFTIVTNVIPPPPPPPPPVPEPTTMLLLGLGLVGLAGIRRKMK